MNCIKFGQPSDPNAPPGLDRSGPLDALRRWVNSTSQWVGSLTWNDAANAATTIANTIDQAGVNVANWATSTIDMAVKDPIGFARTVGEGYLNTQVVVANTFTFGLIPALDSRAQNLMNQSNFYRVVQIGAIVGREVIIQAALGVLTGGAGNVALSAGRVAAGMALRYGGRTAAATVIRAGARLACIAATTQRLTSPVMLGLQVNTMATNLGNAYNSAQAGDGWRAAELFAQSATQAPGMIGALRQVRNLALAATGLGPQRLGDFLTNCFAAGTPIQGEHGARPIESYQPGDLVWARDENDPDAPAELRPIEECFQSECPLVHVHVGGQVIRTTDEHPFWVAGEGWVGAKDLQSGDLLIGRDGKHTPVEEVYETGEVEQVYNFRVGGHHTYFVGDASWGFDVWAHNLCVLWRSNLRRTWNPRTRGISGATVFGKAQSTGATPHAGAVNNVTARVVNNGTFIDPRTGARIDFRLNSTSYVTQNRNLNTALGGNTGTAPTWDPTPPGFGAGTNLRPDGIVVEQLAPGQYCVSMFEVQSPGQRPSDLLRRMQDAYRGLTFPRGASVTRGQMIVMDVTGTRVLRVE